MASYVSLHCGPGRSSSRSCAALDKKMSAVPQTQVVASTCEAFQTSEYTEQTNTWINPGALEGHEHRLDTEWSHGTKRKAGTVHPEASRAEICQPVPKHPRKVEGWPCTGNSREYATPAWEGIGKGFLDLALGLTTPLDTSSPRRARHVTSKLTDHQRRANALRLFNEELRQRLGSHPT